MEGEKKREPCSWCPDTILFKFGGGFVSYKCNNCLCGRGHFKGQLVRIVHFRDIVTCAGCKRTANECNHNPKREIDEDKTYYEGEFICNACRSKLAEIGLDIDSIPVHILHKRIKELNQNR